MGDIDKKVKHKYKLQFKVHTLTSNGMCGYLTVWKWLEKEQNVCEGT